ncbi:hypothetical protein Moror_11699 [Moniliophthora roreri MCA 2997]|uniref:Uncharacterized protein n=1 Tax=Moniliophthora roreri (strain MCA 2997) TaxID=1381753 RepID=V2X4H5_MONRO|nr:hypothetical protein Moror_11699 [Moniliophthora roreri MCA 2997]
MTRAKYKLLQADEFQAQFLLFKINSAGNTSSSFITLDFRSQRGFQKLDDVYINHNGKITVSFGKHRASTIELVIESSLLALGKIGHVVDYRYRHQFVGTGKHRKHYSRHLEPPESEKRTHYKGVREAGTT